MDNKKQKRSKYDGFYERNPHLVNNKFGLLAKGTQYEITKEQHKRIKKYAMDSSKKNN